MRNYILFLLLFISVRSSAQLVGTNLYLQGKYVEIGMNNNGSFGACNNATYGVIPPGYHPHLPGTGALAEVYDYGHDGWAVGAPPYMGDYTYPGSPFEGWEIQINGVRGQCYQTCPGTVTFGAGWLTGSNTSYSNVGGRAIGIWTGSAATGALQIKMETRVDTLASWVNVTVVMKNTSGAALPGVYYWRSCDPDNDQSWPGGAFSTNNQIVYQNDINHRVLVRAQGNLGAMAWLGLGTKDCRARCCVYQSWGLSSGVDLATVWNGTYVPATTLYAAGASNTGDVGMGLVYNIGTIPSLDSAVISYAYMFSNSTAIDSAFPEPQLSVGPVTYPAVAPPAIENDTFNTCDYLGVSSFPIDIHYADDKGWTWSTWTWSPAIGLASTTGVTNTINTSALTGTTTYTITGTDSASGMSSCNTKVFYLTVIPCAPTANFTYAIHRGCAQDTVVFFNNSLGGTEFTWNFGDGTLPVVIDTLEPITHIFTVQGTYNVSLKAYATYCSCSDIHNEFIDIRHSVTADFDTDKDTLCVTQSSTMTDLSTTTVASGPGQLNAWEWNFADSSPLDNTANPVHTFTAPGVYPVKLTVTDSIGCKSSKIANFVVWDLMIVNALTDTTLCLLEPLPLNIDVKAIPNIPWSDYSYLWTPANNLNSDTVKKPYFTGFGDYTYTVTAFLEPYHCPATHTVTIHSVLGAKLMDVTGSTTIKYGDKLQLYSSNEMKYMWTPNDGTLTDNNINNPVASPSVTTTYTVFGMDKYGCVDSANLTITVDSTMNEFVPSGFTPNGDGLNDIFRPTFLKYQKLVEFTVYNRWGQKVFSTSNKDEGWDGTFNSQPQDMGVYFYNIIISRAGYSNNQIFKGEVTLIR